MDKKYMLLTKMGTGIWKARRRDYKLLFFKHDSLYIAYGKFRLRINKPFWYKTK